MSCPDPDTLATFPSLGDEERARVVDHAAECETCRAIISSMAGLDETAPATLAVRGPDVEKPEKIDRYTIERQLGAGAMGVVYAGYDPELARPVAVKVLRAGGSPERMKREAQALAKLTHPNVVAVYDVGEHAGSTFVTMALVDGENLRSWLRGDRTTEQIVDAIVQAARGIEAAHRVGIVHRDLKPDNIFVARTGEVLVGDFGLARSAGVEARGADLRLVDSSELTQTGTLVGTPAYMAPEQLDGDASAASDQYALCVTAWEALYGARPFTGKSLGELERAVRKGPPPDPKSRAVPAHVRKAIRRGLSAEPAQRHSSVAAFAKALAPRRRRWPYVAAIAVVAAGATVFALRRDEASPEARCDEITGPPTTSPGIAKITAPQIEKVVEQHVSRYSVEWTRLARAACVGAAKHELSDPVHATIQRCLDRRAATFAWALKWESPDTMLDVIEALEPIETCRVEQPAPAPAPKLAELQGELDRFAVLVQAAPSMAADYEVFVTSANELGDDGAIAEASYLAGLARRAAGRDAEAILRTAIAHADRARDDRLRARASALLAAVIAQAGRVTEATGQRDLAAAAAARSDDPVTRIALERANVSIGLARTDAAGQLAAFRRIEAIQLAQLGDPSLAVVTTRVNIAGALQVMHDPQAQAAVDAAFASASKLLPQSPMIALQQASLRARTPGQRVALAQQIVTLIRREQPQLLPQELATLSLDYELMGDFEHAFATAQEGLGVVDRTSTLYPDLLESAANAAFEIADRTDDATIRARRLDEATTYLDHLPDNDRTQSLRGRVLALRGSYTEALPLLTSSLATAEKADPPNPFRIAMRSFALAKVLWEVGGTRERARAIALAEQAAARFPEARATFAADPQYGGSVDRVDRQLVLLEAWRRTHRALESGR